jgi:demethylmenaquinone methyltransferase/2-methoxy-6-polyprenyl-1,4-benzoquinol methylase
MHKEAVATFFDNLAPQWDDNLVIDDVKINFILDIAGVHTGTTVLDVACGTGVLFPYYLSRNISKVTGVDLSHEMVDFALRKAKDQRIQVFCGDIETIDILGLYDCCVVYNSFPHFSNPTKLIEKLAEWIKPNGRLTVAHSMSMEDLKRCHNGEASKISIELLPIPDLKEIFSKWFDVNVAISDDEKYIVSGSLRQA